MVLSLFVACSGNRNVSDAADPEFAKYILSHTMGVVSRTSEVQLSVTPDVAKAINKHGNVNDLFSVTPKVNGEVVWDSARTIYFRPKVGLKPAADYTVEFKLGDLVKVDRSFEQFIFGFKTIKPNMTVRFDRLVQASETNKKKMVGEGKVSTADVMTVDELKKVLVAKQGGKELKVEWEEAVNPNTFRYVIQGIERTKGESPELELSWEGSSVNIDVSGKKKVPIPAVDEFKLVDLKVFHEPEQYLLLEFSDGLSEKQYLKGLIKLKKLSGLKYVRNGNSLKVIPPRRISGNYELSISNALENFQKDKLNEAITRTINFAKLKPAIKFVTNGVILPSSDQGLVLPFEAVNLKAVDVVVTKIFENNMLQFLQENELAGKNQVRRVGRPIAHKTIELAEGEIVNANQWNHYYLDLNEMIKPDPGAVYRVYLAFRQEHSIYACQSDKEIQKWTDEELERYWERFESGYFYDDYYDWSNRENPCHKSFYGLRRAVAQNILASNLGLIAKSADQQTITAFVTDLLKAQPLGGVTVKAYDYQQQELGSAVTDGAGKAVLTNLNKPYFVVAEKEKERAYLKVKDGNALSLSRFEVSGNSLKKGLKGYIFGERGVWRPGDSIFVSFMLAEYGDKLPESHPVVFEMKNPADQLVDRQVQTKNGANFYTFRTKTDRDAKTGFYSVNISVGGAKFYKTLKIETVKPNRLKIDMKFSKDYIAVGENSTIDMNVNWLHGAVGKNLQTDVEVILSDKKTTFPKYKHFIFDDPTKKFYAAPQEVFSGRTDESGFVSFTPKIQVKKSAPGMLNAIFVTKAFEKGGNFSVDKVSVPYYPYESFTGLHIEKTDKRYNALVTDESHTAELVTLKPDGKPAKDKQRIEVSIYKLSWRYWYNRSSSDLAYYIRRQNVKPIKTSTVYTAGGKAKWNFQIDKPLWGRFLVRAENKTTGHSTGEIIYMDWPGWVGRSHGGAGEGATMLSFTTDKKKYDLGENIKLNIPSAGGGKALISLENGAGVVASEWIDTEEGYTEHEIPTTKAMTPNIYVHVTLVQPHKQTANDMPIRMYGIVPVRVDVPETHLHPEIKVAEELESEKEFTVTVSEKDDRKMTYTLAIVDEGLLSLTRFRTPTPWDHFYAKEALGVKTWDIFDQIIGAYGGELERLLAIGGDDEASKKGGQKANRFKPVVMFHGPYTLQGGTKKHKLKMPRYVGAVRTMVIARQDKAFGSTSQESKVTKPVMVQATMPRVIGPDETLKLPVSIFAMKKSIKNVELKVKVNDLFEIVGEKSKTVSFSDIGEEFTSFDLKTKSRVGIGKVEVIATSGSHKVVYDVEIDVRTPNTRVTTVLSEAIQSGQTWESEYKPVGMLGTNNVTVELSALPPINLAKRLKYLIRYPHGCIEQTTSSVFPQLFLASITELQPAQRARISNNVRAGIDRLTKFQIFNGGFAYWPGNSDASYWGSNYAGHFIIEAEKAGFIVPRSMKNNWLKFQRTRAKKWANDGKKSQLTQAYRLYTLALAGKPEKGAMNRLREQKNLSKQAKWRLAAAYFISGKEKTAKKLIQGLTTQVDAYTELSGTFGSSARDQAMILETLVHMKNDQEAFAVLKVLSEKLSANRWMSTQTTAYCLIAVSQYVKKYPSADKIKCTVSGGKLKPVQVNSTALVKQVEIEEADETAQLKVKNSSGGVLYARVIGDGIPAAGQDADASNQLKIDVSYFDEDGSRIQPTPLAQGTDFVAKVRITNPTGRAFKEMALSQIFPSGWEIINTRLLDVPNLPSSTKAKYTDIRDDRVYQYFDLRPGKTATFMVRLNASYAGKYYLPSVSAEAMYDASIYARKHGQWVQVTLE